MSPLLPCEQNTKPVACSQSTVTLQKFIAVFSRPLRRLSTVFRPKPCQNILRCTLSLLAHFYRRFSTIYRRSLAFPASPRFSGDFPVFSGDSLFFPAKNIIYQGPPPPPPAAAAGKPTKLPAIFTKNSL
ncbi:hypothetical protein L1887_08228 [Cichorium endivia]|nr:hypothetical protein L1887_08228 [Cichorium endivia]